MTRSEAVRVVRKELFADVAPVEVALLAMRRIGIDVGAMHNGAITEVSFRARANCFSTLLREQAALQILKTYVATAKEADAGMPFSGSMKD